ncbi:DUF4331 family protein [Hymenobacter properus]|uniref:DUF4331 family protein n=1 Tax=Hymenobacter properus TaxID=2791026 RepID=A0A931FI57_9BACT|nr:DUF4331 family protein [Hymenobacter properus]MBF9141702.1 DUF4331 family protein [Hymenobacter properus]MBR7720511.1 DUF4331 family protein [Microvirga sp. SRT04]
MKKLLTRPLVPAAVFAAAVGGMLAWSGQHNTLEASSHREAPLIADDPLADNTDLYVFRSPDAPANDANATATIVANYIPFELPQGGPNFNSFGENIRYEIHVKNNPATTGDDITYRFTFTRTNQDPTTFFRVRLGQENLKTTYQLEQSLAGGAFTTLITAGVVPAPNIGPRSINSAAGLNRPNYQAYLESTIQTVATTGGNMQVFCGPADDAFFTDLGAIFDLGAVRAPSSARDGLARKNVHSIVMKIPVAALVRTGTPALTATTNPLAGTTSPASPVSPYTVGVWASASRLSLRTINADGTRTQTGTYVQVSRLGMPLTNEVIQPVGMKDAWNNDTPYGVAAAAAGSRQAMFEANLRNPELGLYMADNVPVNGAAPKPAGQTYYGEAIQGPVGPTRGLGLLRIQTKSLAGLLPAPLAAGFDFRNGAPGLAPLFGNAATNGTALAPIASGGFGEYLLNNGTSGAPRSVDLLPIFHTGVPNLPPYQLATGKTGGNPLTAGKPFINNFLPTFGDMLRINLAVPPTSRTSADFSSEGLLAAAVLGLTDARYTASGANYIAIPNMDGFPNGRRLEDDVTRIELQAVSGAVLAAIGLWYDDYTVGTSPSPLTTQLTNVVSFSTNVERNDTTFRTAFPYVQTPWSGTNAQRVALAQRTTSLGLSPSLTVAQAYPNPFVGSTTLHFELPVKGTMSIVISDAAGRRVATVAKDRTFGQGVNELTWQPGRDVAPGQYIATLYNGKTIVQSVRIERQ